MPDTTPRTLAIGDIHGCLDALRALAELVPIRPDDIVVTLGDYVDRGPDTRGVIDWLIERARTGALVPLRGNHEVRMLELQHDRTLWPSFLRYGGDATLDSYAGHHEPEALAEVPNSHWEFLRGTRPWYETDTHIFAHAGVDPDAPMSDQTDPYLYWQKILGDPPAPHVSGKQVVCGHTVQTSGLPLDAGHLICIDTWSYGAGWLSCIDVDSGTVWQANQHGETRAMGTDPA